MKDEYKELYLSKIKDKDYEIPIELKDRIVDMIINYAMSLNKITDDILDTKYLINEISKLNILRIGDFKSTDTDINYYGIPVVSVDFKKRRHRSEYINFTKEGKYNSVIAIFSEDSLLENGKMKPISGIDLKNDKLLAKFLFMELTSFLSRTLIKHEILKELGVNNIRYTAGYNMDGRVILNGMTNSNKDLYQGLITYEYSLQKSGIIVHSGLDKGMREYITNLIMDDLGIEYKVMYPREMEIAKGIAEHNSSNTVISKYILNSRKLLVELERHKIDKDIDIIHYVNDNLGKDIDDKIKTYLDSGEKLKVLTRDKLNSFYIDYYARNMI